MHPMVTCLFVNDRVSTFKNVFMHALTKTGRRSQGWWREDRKVDNHHATLSSTDAAVPQPWVLVRNRSCAGRSNFLNLVINGLLFNINCLVTYWSKKFGKNFIIHNYSCQTQPYSLYAKVLDHKVLRTIKGHSQNNFCTFLVNYLSSFWNIPETIL